MDFSFSFCPQFQCQVHFHFLVRLVHHNSLSLPTTPTITDLAAACIRIVDVATAAVAVAIVDVAATAAKLLILKYY